MREEAGAMARRNAVERRQETQGGRSEGPSPAQNQARYGQKRARVKSNRSARCIVDVGSFRVDRSKLVSSSLRRVERSERRWRRRVDLYRVFVGEPNRAGNEQIALMQIIDVTRPGRES